MKALVPIETIVSKILVLRGEKVLLDRDLAELYGVTTKALNQAVKRNRKRFPSDFMFPLTKEERDQLVTNCDRFRKLKHSVVLPHAFTEQGVAMLSSVLHSDRAIARPERLDSGAQTPSGLVPFPGNQRLTTSTSGRP